MKRFVWLSVMLVAGAACGGKASTGGQAPTPAAAPGGGSATRAAPAMTASAPAKKSGPNLISSADIQKQDLRNAYEAVQRLRPQWLRGRGSVTLGDRNGESTLPIVYVDGVKYGSLDLLNQIPVTQVNEIQFINASDATTRWGTGLPGGVIHVLSKGGAKR